MRVFPSQRVRDQQRAPSLGTAVLPRGRAVARAERRPAASIGTRVGSNRTRLARGHRPDHARCIELQPPARVAARVPRGPVQHLECYDAQTPPDLFFSQQTIPPPPTTTHSSSLAPSLRPSTGPLNIPLNTKIHTVKELVVTEWPTEKVGKPPPEDPREGEFILMCLWAIRMTCFLVYSSTHPQRQSHGAG